MTKPLQVEVQPGVVVDTRRALFLRELRALVVADIHWGYSAAHRVAGNLLPVWGDDEICATLRALIADHRPAELIWLGDSLHGRGADNAAERFLSCLGPDGPRISILAGNHDRSWKRPLLPSLTRGRYFFHHGDRPAAPLPADATEVVGHFHPAVGWRDGAGTRLRIPALVSSERRLILPAFSPWAGGMVWNDQLKPGEKLWAVAQSRIFEVRLTRQQAAAASS